MKLSKYAALVRKESFCAVFHIENEGMWLGTQSAIFRATELPEFRGEEQAQAILSLSDKQMEKVVLREYDCEDICNVLGYDLREFDRMEQTTKPVSVIAVQKGIYASALRTEDGELLFYNDSYLSPLLDEINDGNYLELTARKLLNGQRYIVVKNGLNILGIILPLRIVNEKFLGDLQEFQALCTEQLFREQERAGAAEDAARQEENEDQTSMEGMNDGTEESD